MQAEGQPGVYIKRSGVGVNFFNSLLVQEHIVLAKMIVETLGQVKGVGEQADLIVVVSIGAIEEHSTVNNGLVRYSTPTVAFQMKGQTASTNALNLLPDNPMSLAAV
jgi:hypothetical protein